MSITVIGCYFWLDDYRVVPFISQQQRALIKISIFIGRRNQQKKRILRKLETKASCKQVNRQWQTNLWYGCQLCTECISFLFFNPSFSIFVLFWLQHRNSIVKWQCLRIVIHVSWLKYNRNIFFGLRKFYFSFKTMR